MHEYTPAPVDQELEQLVFQHIVPERDEGGGSSIHHVNAIVATDLLDEYVKLLFVDHAGPQDVEMFGVQVLELAERGVHGIGIDASDAESL